MLPCPRRVRDDFGRAAASYTQYARVQWDILQILLALARPYIPENAKLLDVGCGPGWIGQALDEQGIHARTVAMDIAESMCAQAKARGLEALCASAERLPFAPESFDTLISALCVQWLGAPERFLHGAAQVLKPGGCAAIATLGPQTLSELNESFLAHGEPDRVMRLRSEKEWADMARSEGLSVVHMHAMLWRYPYASLGELLRTLRSIGATNKYKHRRRGMTGAELLSRVEASYEARHARPTGGIWASWQPLLLILKKP